ncbi:Fe2+-dependent dioxygenase [Ramlibacter sp.]|uniref:Fe2+-dependent dioxygenase n=1 Tax=Ramlibacter sp. TaxID=1917967 RepID=UPI003D0F0125
MMLTLPLLDAEEVRHARALLARAPWAEGRATAGAQAALAKNNEQLPADGDIQRELQQMVLRALDRSPRFLSAALPRKVFPPRFNRYAGDSNSFGMHVDGSIRYAEGGVRVRTDLSCTVFLSELEDYDGGELVIRDPGGSRRVKLPAGQAVLYEGTTLHEVAPVTRGARLASFFWVESMVRSAERRRLLLELDDALTALRQRHGEDASTVALVGTYHNLLRMWAET